MASPEDPRPGRRARRDPRRERNRQRLVEAALHLVAAEGRGLTVAAVTRQAAMDPSGFYAHFRNIEDCERAAADLFKTYVEGHVRAYAELRTATDFEAAVEGYAALMDSWLTRPDWIALTSRCRFANTPLGTAVREILAAVRTDVNETLWDLAIAQGMRGHHLAEVEALAEQCVGLFVMTLERLAAGRGGGDVQAAARQLARANQAVVRAAFVDMLARDASGRPEQG